MSHRIVIKKLGPGSAQKVLEFFKREFIRNEPLCECLGLVNSGPYDLEVLRLAEKGISLGAFDTEKKDRLVGVHLATTFKRGETNPIYDEVDNHPIEEKYQKIYDLTNYAKTIANEVIHDKLGFNEYVDAVITSVHSEYAGQGIGAKMFKELVKISKEMQFKCIYIGCTSYHSANYIAKEGAQEVLRIPYMQNSVPIFPVKPPHDAFKGFLKFI